MKYKNNFEVPMYDNLFGEESDNKKINIKTTNDDIDVQFKNNIYNHLNKFFLKSNIKDITRSTDKQSTLHDIIREPLEDFLVNSGLYKKYHIVSLTERFSNNGEFKVSGYIRCYNIDITIVETKTSKPIIGISCKNPISSYNKNKGNYMNDITGDSNNILNPISKETNQIKFFEFYLMYNYIPRFTGKDNIGGWDIIDDENIECFDNVMLPDKISGNRPHEFLLCVIQDDLLENKMEKVQEYMDIHKSLKNDIKFYKTHYKFKSDLIYNNPSLFIQKIINEIKEYDSKN